MYSCGKRDLFISTVLSFNENEITHFVYAWMHTHSDKRFDVWHRQAKREQKKQSNAIRNDKKNKHRIHSTKMRD